MYRDYTQGTDNIYYNHGNEGYLLPPIGIISIFIIAGSIYISYLLIIDKEKRTLAMGLTFFCIFLDVLLLVLGNMDIEYRRELSWKLHDLAQLKTQFYGPGS